MVYGWLRTLFIVFQFVTTVHFIYFSGHFAIGVGVLLFPNSFSTIFLFCYQTFGFGGVFCTLASVS